MPKPAAPAPPANQLLAALSRREFNRLLPHLEPVPLPLRHVLAEEGEPISSVYFPTSGVVSLLSRFGNESTIEVGLVGREGMTGLPLILGVGTTLHRCLVQVPGEAFRVDAKPFRTLAAPGTPLHNLLLRYVHGFLVQLSVSVGCNALHSIEKRLGRWLLTVQRRTGADRFPMTHEFLAAMLGVRRATVSEVMKKMQRRGLIRCGRGHITILNRRRLESAACECFPLHEARLASLFGGVVS